MTEMTGLNKMTKGIGILDDLQKIETEPGKNKHLSGLILSLCPANERCRYKITPSFIGWAQT